MSVSLSVHPDMSAFTSDGSGSTTAGTHLWGSVHGQIGRLVPRHHPRRTSARPLPLFVRGRALFGRGPRAAHSHRSSRGGRRRPDGGGRARRRDALACPAREEERERPARREAPRCKAGSCPFQAPEQDHLDIFDKVRQDEQAQKRRRRLAQRVWAPDVDPRAPAVHRQ